MINKSMPPTRRQVASVFNLLALILKSVLFTMNGVMKIKDGDIGILLDYFTIMNLVRRVEPLQTTEPPDGTMREETRGCLD